MIEAIIWFLLGYVSGGVVGMLIFALITANGQKRESMQKREVPQSDPCEECLRWPECNGVDESCPMRKREKCR